VWPLTIDPGLWGQEAADDDKENLEHGNDSSDCLRRSRTTDVAPRQSCPRNLVFCEMYPHDGRPFIAAGSTRDRNVIAVVLPVDFSRLIGADDLCPVGQLP
jgi:hypothetical protein